MKRGTIETSSAGDATLAKRKRNQLEKFPRKKKLFLKLAGEKKGRIKNQQRKEQEIEGEALDESEGSHQDQGTKNGGGASQAGNGNYRGEGPDLLERKQSW